ncbi:MAG: hypothetical protein QXE81_04530 [Desulfurococcaceae archaeon]
MYDLEVIRYGLNRGIVSYRSLYGMLIKYYCSTIHQGFKRFATRTDNSRIEFFLGILFNGKGFIVEGEEDHVRTPGLPLCLSAHTHPGGVVLPSRRDLEAILKILADRGIGHVITTSRQSVALYRI